MKYLHKYLPLFVAAVCLAGCKKDNNPAPPQTPDTSGYFKAPANFRVIGYMYTEDAASTAGKSFDLTRINYLNIAFLNPDANGNFASIGTLAPIITAAHSKNVKVMGSLAGADAPTYWSALLSDGTRNQLIQNIVQVAVNNNLDGIDIDLEGEQVDGHYEAFVTGLATALKAQNKLLSAAVATWEAGNFTDNALAAFDFLNVMSYDATGPWDPADPGPQSPYSMAVADLAYWGTTRGIAGSRLNLGVPFYGYGFGPGVQPELDYNAIVKAYPRSQNEDQYTVKAGGTIYYNGIPTIQKKTTLAMQSAGGIMVWELMGDATGSASLLNAIDETANPSNN